MTTESAYSLGDDGILKVGTQFPVIVFAFMLGIIISTIVTIGFDFGNWIPMTVAFTLLMLPLIGEYRSRRLRRLLGMPREALRIAAGVTIAPWPSIQFMSVKGRSLTVRFVDRMISATLDEDDISRLRAKGAATLGEGTRFIFIPEEPRHSPIRRFAILFVFLFALTQVITIAASLGPFFPGEQARYTTLYNSVKGSLGPTPFQEWGEIYFNNVQIALESFVPGFGEFVLSASSYNTGRIIQAAAIQFGVAPTSFLSLLYVLPHSWVEELSYPLAGALGLYAFTWRKQSFSQFSNWRTRASTKVSLGFLLIALMLGVAGVLEVTEPSIGIGALLLWAPVGILAFVLYSKFRRRIIPFFT